MKIIHVINSMSASCGGPSRTALLTVRGLNQLGINARLLTKRILPDEIPISEESFIHYLPVPRWYNPHWGYAKSFQKALLQNPDTDIYHIQGIWQYPGYITAKHAVRMGRPYLITLHGTLYPEAMRSSSFVKKISLSLFQRKQLQMATCIHATCVEEMEYYRSLGFTNPVAVLPYPMECSEKAEPFFADGVKRVGYLGRIHPRKRVERLLEVWSRLSEPGELVIMGDGDPVYMDFLKKETTRLLLKRVRFTGFVIGLEKERLLASLTCLAVPSDFENLGIIIPEALLQEVPVIASTGSPWQELNTNRCGWWVNNDLETLTETISNALVLDEDWLHEMGRRGRELILNKYGVEVVSQQMKQLYDWAAGSGVKPEFVYPGHSEDNCKIE